MQDDNQQETDDEWREEQLYIAKVVSAFKTYKLVALRSLSKHLTDLKALSTEEQVLLLSHAAKIKAVRHLLEANQRFLNAIVDSIQAKDSRENEDTHKHFDFLNSLLRQFVRDWSLEGQKERDFAYSPILDALSQNFRDSRNQVSVLVPGAGLGRLAYEISKLGFVTQGNEFSYFMLFASEFVLNRCDPNGLSIHPYLLQFANQYTIKDQLREIRIPDEVPVLTDDRLSMVAGDFLQVYDVPGQIGRWDCVVTCFFIDTAKNVVAYLKLIGKLLKPGGKWINFGPLMYHFEDDAEEISVELSWEEVEGLAKTFGLRFDRVSKELDSTYSQNTRSMLWTTYKCVFSIATKAN